MPDEHIGYLFGGWFTMGHLLTLPMLIGGVVLLVLAYRNPQPSGNVLRSAA
jgi:phosphatidylglycerol:prolipoprotein diacylglycerol transferase